MNGIQPIPLSTDTIWRSGMPVEHAGEDQVGDDTGVADEQQGPADGELGVRPCESHGYLP